MTLQLVLQTFPEVRLTLTYMWDYRGNADWQTLGHHSHINLHKQSRKRGCGVYLLPGHFIAQRLLNPQNMQGQVVG